jgi:hypothetical protein
MSKRSSFGSLIAFVMAATALAETAPNTTLARRKITITAAISNRILSTRNNPSSGGGLLAEKFCVMQGDLTCMIQNWPTRFRDSGGSAQGLRFSDTRPIFRIEQRGTAVPGGRRHTK